MFCVLWALLPDSNKWMDGWIQSWAWHMNMHLISTVHSKTPKVHKCVFV